MLFRWHQAGKASPHVRIFSAHSPEHLAARAALELREFRPEPEHVLRLDGGRLYLRSTSVCQRRVLLWDCLAEEPWPTDIYAADERLAARAAELWDVAVTFLASDCCPDIARYSPRIPP